jgi:hypothetical protein
LVFLAKEKKKVMKQTQEKKTKEEKENKHNKRLQDSHVCDDTCCSLVQYKEQTSVAKKKNEK